MVNEAKLLLILTGHAREPVRAAHGDFDKMFWDACEVKGESFAACDANASQIWPQPTDYSGILLSGSASMLDEQTPWMLATIEFIRGAVKRGIPLLGICFGHQLLAAAFGAQIGPNPKGRAFGTAQVNITDTDALLNPGQFFAQVSHRDIILKPSSDIQVVGSAEHDFNHAIRVGDKAWGVQFHPEWSADVSRDYVRAREQMLAKEYGAEKVQAAIAGIKESPEAAAVLKRFAALALETKKP